MINEKYQDNLAKTAVQIGVNIQPGQFLVINSPIETADFARKIAKQAFDLGAEDVYINYTDSLFNKLRLDNISKKSLEEIPDWWTERLNSTIERGAAIITILASDPDLMKNVDRDKLMTSTRAHENASESYSKALMENKNRWCVLSVPTENWAKKVFPETKSGSAAMDLLWNAILRATYSNGKNPIEFWHEHNKELKERAKYLTDKQYKELRYTSSNGTDLKIGLPKDHVWNGGSEVASDGIDFFPNMPTEEIYTSPNKFQVNGHVVGTLPLVYHGKTICDFSLDFKNGKVTNVKARKNEELLKEIIKERNGDFLGEVALVPTDSPLSDMNLLFYNTLFDENSSSHLALGNAYPNTVKDGNELSEEELISKGLNNSPIHVDFMIGNEDLKVVGITQDNQEEVIMENGDFVF